MRFAQAELDMAPRLVQLVLSCGQNACMRPVDNSSATRPKRSPADPQKFAVDVKPSAIDGQGAFAAEPIPARRKIGEIRGESVSVRTARQRAKGRARIMIVEVSDRRAIDASQSSDPLRYTNHSCRPNAVLRIRQGRVEFYAMRDVATGEELTVNYGETHHEGRLACRCGAPGCVGRL
jgi:SET domain-containing protein